MRRYCSWACWALSWAPTTPSPFVGISSGYSGAPWGGQCTGRHHMQARDSTYMHTLRDRREAWGACLRTRVLLLSLLQHPLSHQQPLPLHLTARAMQGTGHTQDPGQRIQLNTARDYNGAPVHVAMMPPHTRPHTQSSPAYIHPNNTTPHPTTPHTQNPTPRPPNPTPLPPPPTHAPRL